VAANGERGLCTWRLQPGAGPNGSARVLLDVRKTDVTLVERRSALLDALQQSSVPATAASTAGASAAVVTSETDAATECAERGSAAASQSEPSQDRLHAAGRVDVAAEASANPVVRCDTEADADAEEERQGAVVGGVVSSAVSADAAKDATAASTSPAAASSHELPAAVGLVTAEPAQTRAEVEADAKERPPAASGGASASQPAGSAAAALRQPPRSSASGALALRVQAARAEAEERQRAEALQREQEAAAAARARQEEVWLRQAQDQEFQQSLLMDQLKDLMARQTQLREETRQLEVEAEEAGAMCTRAAERLQRFGANPRREEEVHQGTERRVAAEARLAELAAQLAELGWQIEEKNELLAAMLA